MPIVQVLYIPQSKCVFHQGSLEGLFRHESLVLGFKARLSKSHLSIQTSQMSALFQMSPLHKGFVGPTGFSLSSLWVLHTAG